MIHRRDRPLTGLLNNKPMFEPNQQIELIQQWQYTGCVHPRLLEDKTFKCTKQAGLTSIQSYVYWAEIEKMPGKIDFSSYDPLVEKVIKHKLKWVLFFILGPYYATPEWFQASEESVYAKCLEHGKESKIQSIWNPNLPKHVERFLGLVANHYQDHSVFESITLGISGNWGESIYPVAGGFGTNFHTHRGWWCADRCAIESFRKYLSIKYTDIKRLNDSYNKRFNDFSEVTFPFVRQTGWKNLHLQLKNMIPGQVKPLLRPIWRGMRSTWNNEVAPYIKRFRSSFSRDTIVPHSQQRWLDFVNWYMSSMTEWAEFWLKTARKYFPETEIYLVTGGHGEPQLGADFSEQTKMVSKYNAGIRITNQTDDYAESFIFTRLVSSASRYYGAYFTTEEEGINQPQGVTMRVFDAATSEAKGVYFKSIIGTGTDACTGQTYTLGEPTQGALNLKQNLHHFKLQEPIIDVAVLFPNTSIALNAPVLESLYKQCSLFRNFVDFDLIDENMIADGALNKYKFLILLDGNWLRHQTLIEIRDWVKKGGILIASKYLLVSTIGSYENPYRQLFPQKKGTKRNSAGYALLLDTTGRSFLKSAAEAIYNREGKYPWTGIPEIEGYHDGIYATRFLERILYYNPKNSEIRSELIK